MANNNNKNKANKTTNKEVLLIKLIIIFIILLVPIIFMVLTTSNRFLVYKQDDQVKQEQIEGASISNLNKSAQEDFDLNVPTANRGNLENVDQEEIDSLFNNLK